MAQVKGKRGAYLYTSMDTGAVMHLFDAPARAAQHFVNICSKIYLDDTTFTGASPELAKRLAKGEAVTGWFEAESGEKHYRKVEFKAFLDA